MFIRRSRYDSLLKECAAHMDEITFLRGQLAKSEKQNEKKEETIQILYREAKDHAAAMSRKAVELKEAQKDGQRLDQLKRDMKSLNSDIEEYMLPIPKDAEERALYVSRVAGYFNGGLRDYLNYMISSFKAEIARFPLSERETDYFRSCVNVCYLLQDWGTDMVNEHFANARGDEATQDAFEHLEDDEVDESVENIKNAVNK